MEKRVVRRTPDQLGYHDRGKMKWQGLILSDMSEMLKEHQASEKLKRPEAKKQMNLLEITEILQEAYLMKKKVKIQANIIKNGHYYPDLHCLIKGCYENEVYFQLNNGQIKSCEIKQIRHISY